MLCCRHAQYNTEYNDIFVAGTQVAYNTHINGLIANMSINESFLSTSQLRSSVVSHAESLGYFPTSMTAARAVVDVEITVLNNAPTSLPLNAGSKFFVTIDETNYEFFTLQTYEAINDTTGKFVFPNVTLVEGKVKTKDNRLQSQEQAKVKAVSYLMLYKFRCSYPLEQLHFAREI